MCQVYNPIHCIVPPYMLERMLESEDPEVRRIATETLVVSAELRAIRATMPRERTPALAANPPGTKWREVYDLENRWPFPWNLPGTLVRAEGDPPSSDIAVNEAYNHSGATYDFYYKLFHRNSLDDRGMLLISSVHARRKYNNAFWNGRQMVYGDGDNLVFQRFTASLDVIAHEMTHGVVDFTSDLEYHDEPGALNEHFADVFGSLVKQWSLKQDVNQASWLIGEEILIQAPTRQALRSMKAPGEAYKDDPYLGSDPQPRHMAQKYMGNEDNGGVHINSGIPNHAFYLAATKIGRYAWEVAGRIWYRAMMGLHPTSQFLDAATLTCEIAGAAEFGGADGNVQRAVREAWASVGLEV